jgi:hypothetical protein
MVVHDILVGRDQGFSALWRDEDFWKVHVELGPFFWRTVAYELGEVLVACFVGRCRGRDRLLVGIDRRLISTVRLSR